MEKEGGHNRQRVIVQRNGNNVVLINKSSVYNTFIVGSLGNGDPTPLINIWQSEASQWKTEWQLGWDGLGGPELMCLGKMRPTYHYASPKGGSSGKIWKHIIKHVFIPLWPDISPDNPSVMLKDGGPGCMDIEVKL